MDTLRTKVNLANVLTRLGDPDSLRTAKGFQRCASSSVRTMRL
jgi:hypothetical protein